MSQFNRRDLSKKAEKLQKEISNSSSLWGKTLEEEQQDIQRIKNKWQKKQQKKFKHLQKKQEEKKNVRVIISSLVSIGIIAVFATVMPSIWQVTSIEMAESFTPENPDNKEQLIPKSNKTGLLDEVRELKNTTRNSYSNPSKSNNHTISPPLPCQLSDSSECTVNGQSVNQPVSLEEKIVETTDKIGSYYDELNKAIRMSDGEHVSLEKNN